MQKYSWDEMLRLFRLLGGTAENVILKEGALGRGLMAQDPARPIRIRIPTNLLFNVEDVEFTEDRLRLKKMVDIPEPERMFFEAYEDGFSWGGGGRSQSIDFIVALDSLPAEVRELLVTEFGFESLLHGESSERAQRRFLQSRMLRWAGRDTIMPIIELANHSFAGLPYRADDGVHIEGIVKDEVLVTYGPHDTFSIFQTFGFLSVEPGAFSLATKMQLEDRELLVFRDVSAPIKRGDAWIPQLTTVNGMPALAYLMIGHRSMPRQPRGIFRALAREAGLKRCDEAFDSILQFNWAKFLKLLMVLDAHEGSMVDTLRKMARYQLEAISHCIGAIEPEEARPEKEEVWSMSIQ